VQHGRLSAPITRAWEAAKAQRRLDDAKEDLDRAQAMSCE
jgi:hypothetical protein